MTDTSTFKLSKRVQAVKPSQTLAISALAAQLRAEGRDVIGLGVGEPDFNTPEHVSAAAKQAIDDGKTRYTAVDGTVSLKQAIINKFKRFNQLDYNADQILVSSGGKQSFYNLAQAMLEDGDEVIIPAPYWVSYPDMVILANAKPVIVTTNIENGLKLTAEQLEKAITPKTRLLVINSPSNPTGIAYTRDELVALGEVLKKHKQVFIATDDMYEHILWTEASFVNILMACPELYDRTIVLSGVSKAYAMTGWRIGYAGGPADLIKAMKKIQSQSTSNASSVSQAAAEAALNGDQQCITDMTVAFKERHDYVVKRLNAMDGVTCLPSDGTFYSFPCVMDVIDRLDGIESDLDLASLLLDKVGVALVPGSAFGSPGYIRISFAISMEVLEDALNRIEKAFS